MFLSPQVSSLEPDGSLVVDLADERGPRLRFGPIETGMDWARWEGDRWVPTDTDYGVRLAHQPHAGRRDLPVNQYLTALPRPFVEALYPISHVQATLLQLAARWPGVRDLVTGNLGLAWLIAGSYAAEPHARHRIVAARELPQKALLETLLEQAVRPAQVKLLTRIVVDVGDRSAWVQLKRAVTDERLVMRLNHWPQVPVSLLGLFNEAPYLASLEMLRAELAVAQSVYEILRVVRQRRTLVRDTARLARLVRPAGGAARALTRCRSWERFKRLHQEFNATVQALGWETLLDSGIDPAREFGVPPISATPEFQPIRTVAELIEEGQTMRHCVVTRAPEVMEGRAAIYRVNVAGERATLEVSVGRNREPLAIEDFRLKQNEEPSEPAWEAAHEFLIKGREVWMRERGEI